MAEGPRERGAGRESISMRIDVSSSLGSKCMLADEDRERPVEPILSFSSGAPDMRFLRGTGGALGSLGLRGRFGLAASTPEPDAVAVVPDIVGFVPSPAFFATVVPGLRPGFFLGTPSLVRRTPSNEYSCI